MGSTSKTRLTAEVRALKVESVLAGLAERPDLLPYRDDRGRNWLHLTASINLPEHPFDGNLSVFEYFPR